MENSVISNIFKFVTLRAPQNFEYQKDLITIIKDHRIQDKYLPEEIHNVANDEDRFSGSEVGKHLLDQIKVHLPNVNSNKDVISLNNVIAEEVKNKFTIDERTQRLWLDDFVAVIKQHMTDFNKVRLLTELDDIIKKYLPRLTGISDYVEAVSDENSSQFCNDFNYLFERLYVLYVCKRRYPLNLEYIIDAQRALHLIRFLKIELDQKERIPTNAVKGCLYTLLTLLRRKDRQSYFTDKVEVLEDSDEQRFVKRTDCAIRQLTADTALIPKVTIETREDFASLFYNASPYLHQLFACLLGYYKPFNDIRPIGIGDLLVVKQFLCKYEAGEIAHVENVLKGESKERSYRRLDRTEDIFVIQTETNEVTESEFQSTDRYELKTESESTIQSDLNAEIAGAVSASYGTVNYSVSAGVSYSLSTNDARRSANNFAKDIVDRSLNRIQKRVSQERTTKKTYEVEEINKHGLNNTKGSSHISGIYRWLDKHYKAQVYNYGKRLMFEFVIPEPAAFIKTAFERNKKRENKPQSPNKPVFPALVIDQIDDATVNAYAALYNIADFEPKPPDTITIRSQPIQMTNAGDSTREFILDIPIGYEVSKANAAGSRQRRTNRDAGLYVAVGGENRMLGSDQAGNVYDTFDLDYESTGNLRDKLSIAVLSYGLQSYAFNVVITVKLTPERKREWQIKTYTKIMDAYEKKLAEYESALTEYQDKLDGYNASQGIMIQGRNPRINQEIIKTELKKHCITMIAKQFDNVKADDIQFNAMKERQENVDEETTVVTETKKVTQATPTLGTTVTVTETTVIESTTTSPVKIKIPAIDILEARDEGNIIQFLEQSFEWTQISYLLYPYFWGRMPNNWFEAQTFYEEEDLLYGKFLQAGSVRILVAVRPAYEVAVMHYLCTQKPWNGGPAPGINNPMYISIFKELRNQQDDLYGAEPYGTPWEVVMPTSLVYLQDNPDLPMYDCTPPTQKK
jgi:hypothetical protein